MAEKNTRSILKNIKSKLTKFDKKAEKSLEAEEDSEFEYLTPQDPEEEEAEEKPVEVGAEGILEFEVDGKNHDELGIETPGEPVDEKSESLLASKAREDELLGVSDVPAAKNPRPNSYRAAAVYSGQKPAQCTRADRCSPCRVRKTPRHPTTANRNAHCRCS